MDTNKYIAWYSNLIMIFIGITSILTQIRFNDFKTSSPVEEMYHRQLVVTIDSILDAKLYVEPIDSDDITLPHDQFGRVILPLDYK